MNGNITDVNLQNEKQEELNQLLSNLDDIADNATIVGRSVFNGNFNVTIPTGSDEGFHLDLTSNPDVIYDLQSIDKIIQRRFNGLFDRCGEEVKSNDDYIVIGARDTSTFGEHDKDSNGVQLTGQDYIDSNRDNKDGIIQVVQRSTGKMARISIKS